MKSKATTVAAYLDSLPPDRREALQTVRRVLLDNLGTDFQECMQYGVIGYCVPHSLWPHGHHTRPELPLMYMGLSSQKNDMVVYMLCLYQNEPMREWFDKAWSATGRKSYLEVSGAGCCLRFKKVEDLSLDLIAETIRRVPLQKYLANHTAALASMGKGPDGKPLKKSRGAGGAGKAKVSTKAKSPPTPPKKKTAKKKPAPKRG